MSYSVSGIAFSAMPINYLNSNNENHTTITTAQTKGSNYSYKSSSIDAIFVEFRDPINGKNVSVSLNDNVLDKLNTHFSTQNFNKNEDNSITLNGQAEKFVSGWFGDIAYKREFLDADKNRDGVLTDSEYMKTKNDFNLKGAFYDRFTIDEQITSNYVFSNKIDSNYIRRPNNHVKKLDEELNRTIISDKNFDSKIDMEEAYNTIGGVENVLLFHVKDTGLLDKSQKQNNPFDSITLKKTKQSLNKSPTKTDDLKKQLVRLPQTNIKN
jgi:hypothetical protein